MDVFNMVATGTCGYLNFKHIGKYHSRLLLFSVILIPAASTPCGTLLLKATTSRLYSGLTESEPILT